MKYPTAKIRIECASNPDWCGTYHKDDITDEMNTLGHAEHAPWAWIEYVIDHVLEEYASEAQDAIECFLKNDNLRAIAVYIDGKIVNIQKFKY